MRPRISWLLAFIISLPAQTQGQTLRQLVDASDFHIGAFIDPVQTRNDTQYKAIASEFNFNIMPRFMRDVETSPGVYTWTVIDSYLNTGQSLDMRTAAQSLVYRNSTSPAWPGFTNTGCGPYTPDQVRAVTKDYIQTVIQHRPERYYVWEVVNEAASTPNSANCWSQKLGYPQYVIDAFRFAGEVHPPGMLLRLNETFGFANESMPIIQKTLALIDAVQAAGAPIDILGVENHLNLDTIKSTDPPTIYIDNFRLILREAAKRHIQVQVSEIDIYQGTSNDFAGQAQVYSNIFDACFSTPWCTSFSTWGVYDKVTWWRTQLKKPDAQPLLFDMSYQSKPAYQAIKTLLQNKPRAH